MLCECTKNYFKKKSKKSINIISDSSADDNKLALKGNIFDIYNTIAYLEYYGNFEKRDSERLTSINKRGAF